MAPCVGCGEPLGGVEPCGEKMGRHTIPESEAEDGRRTRWSTMASWLEIRKYLLERRGDGAYEEVATEDDAAVDLGPTWDRRFYN